MDQTGTYVNIMRESLERKAISDRDLEAYK